MSPRSTTKWYSTASSIGIYPSGLNEDGQKSDYRDNLSSHGAFFAGIHWMPSAAWRVQAWNLFTDQIMNAALLQADYTHTIRDKQSITAAVQAIRQDAVKDGGNPDPSKTYMRKGAKSMVLSLKSSYRSGPWETGLAYTRITAHGRYLMPREWGRDPFFTFLPRERNEGMGDLHAVVARGTRRWDKAGLQTTLAAGYYNTPDISDVRLNKYGFPDYWQGMADLRYAFKGLFQGLEVQALFIHKWQAGKAELKPGNIFNKVNMGHYNLVLNYHF